MGSICSQDKTDAFRALFGSELSVSFHKRNKSTQETYFAIIMCVLLIQPLIPPIQATVRKRLICSKIPGLSPRQRHICYDNPDAIIIADEGSFMGLEECRRQFKHSRWNCRSKTKESAMGNDERTGTKEAAFHGAIRAAGVLHAIAKACTEGKYRGCGCNESKRGYFSQMDYQKWGVARVDKRDAKTSPSSWTWGGCSVDIKQANRLCRDIWDTREVSRNTRAKMNLHNYEAGRKNLMKRLKVQCKCHGASASCALHTCWTTLPDFREVGNALRNAYQRSKQAVEQRGRNPYSSLVIIRNGVPKKPQKRELVYVDDSPNYCVYNDTSKTDGTEGRVCRSMSADRDDCSYLCCGRGHEVQRKIRTWDCKCKFYWCCHVECDQCQEPAKQYTCL